MFCLPGVEVKTPKMCGGCEMPYLDTIVKRGVFELEGKPKVQRKIPKPEVQRRVRPSLDESLRRFQEEEAEMIRRLDGEEEQ